jgi:primosomal protein N' (replication factor Y)
MFYKVLVQSASFHGHEALTYSYDESRSGELAVGCLVEVPLQRKAVLGVVTEKVAAKPHFATKAVVRAYTELPALPVQLLTLAMWLRDYYPAPLGIITQTIMPGALTDKHVLAALAPAAAVPYTPVALPPLTTDQKAALSTLEPVGVNLLHGETGSGKTRVYVERVQAALTTGASALLLTPEIGLTSQLSKTLQDTFGDRVLVIHSQLTPAERQRIWLQILCATLFTPLRQIGLIVVDEFHEPAYKQEQAPHYQAVRVASQLAALHKSQLILGSATPPVVDYFLAEQKHKPIVRMLGTARGQNEHALQTHIVDLKDRTNFSGSQYISNTLVRAITNSLQKGEQSLLYLNRRGSARLILCDVCGWQALCPHCDLPLTYHNDSHKLLCHTCGITETTPSSCPSCGNVEILFTSIGTKALSNEVQRLFPEARVQRFDTDNTKSESLAVNFSDVAAGKVDILVGTQLLAKGLDLPRLSTLGVILADSSLALPDFTSGERTYQLLSQVLGRVGRGHRSGQAVVQTYQPANPVLQAALSKDWSAFYEQELAERKAFMFPPFCYLLQLTCRRASAASAQKAADNLCTTLSGSPLRVRLQGPAPAFREKLIGKYQWQIIVKATDRRELLKVIDLLPSSGWSFDIDPATLL